MATEMIALNMQGDCNAITIVTDGDLFISGSVGLGGRNVPEDVRKIQEALNTVPPVRGGPVPGLTVDGVAGKLTIDAISRFQRQNVGFFDGRVDPDNVTIAKLRTFTGGDDTPALGSPPAAPAAKAKKKSVLKAPKNPKTPALGDLLAMKTVVGFLKEAQRWVFLGDTVAARAQDHLVGPNVFKTQAEKAFADCDKFFKLKTISKGAALNALAFMRHIFQRMRTAIEAQIRLDVDPNSPLGFFQVDPTDNNVAPPPEALMFTEFAGFDARDRNGRPKVTANGFRADSIFVATKQVIAEELKLPASTFANDHTYLIIHELAHFVGPGRKSINRLDDHAARHRDAVKFDKLDHFHALHNADSYGRFCAQVAGAKLSAGFKQV